ncbi:DNA helicase B-like [Montipora capricornis]|uniref:DNA helicase B-like n=1 Tax=Montipora capricornis TaxID=246305 RepID=UPI0035F1761A
MSFFTGYTVIAEEDEENGEEDSDLESDSEDDREGADFDFLKTPSRQLRQVVQTMREVEVNNGLFIEREKTEVHGKFDPMFSYPWCMVEVKINPSKSSNNVKRASHLPSYSYRMESGPDVLSLFLRKGCKVDEQHAARLLEFIRINNLKSTLKDLFENLRKFGDSSEDNKSISEQILVSLSSSPTGKAFAVPLFLKFVHRLLPRQVCSIFDDCDLKTLESLNEAVLREPWLFGYWTVLKTRFGLSGCEAKIESFKECNLFQGMPVVKKDSLLIYHSLCKIIKNEGHTYVHLHQLKERQRNISDWEESLAYLSEIGAVKTSEEQLGNRRLVFLPHLRWYEQNIARNLSHIMTQTPWIGNAEIDDQAFNGDEDQIKAAHLMTKKPLVVMSGRGGCGKTFVVSNVLSASLALRRKMVSQSDEEDSEQMMKEIEDEVLLTAPTGKAASLLSKRTGISSHTLHSVIYSCLFWEQEGKDDWKFSKVRVLVCDECSLISVRVFSKLISCLEKYASLQQVILLGDINQLPSIEPGNFLSDMYTRLEAHGAAVSLRTNHRSDSELIVQNAAKISVRQMPTFDPLRKFFSVTYTSKHNVKDSETNAVTNVIKDVLHNEDLQDHRSSQFVAFRRKDCKVINELCALHYNEHSIVDSHRKPDYRVGDKICVKRNRECYDAYTRKTVKLCNGEIFFIKDVIEEQDNSGKKRVFFSVDNGDKLFKIRFGELLAAKLTHAWARTIHTFQGSEIDTLVYVVGQPHYQNWQHVYTAVTRGIKQVFIINNPAHLKRAIETLPIARQTKLKENLASTDSKTQLQLSSEELFTSDGSSSERAGEFCTTGVSCMESHDTLLQPAIPPRVSDFQSPSRKRKYPE